jgi:hypothetical protein
MGPFFFELGGRSATKNVRKNCKKLKKSSHLIFQRGANGMEEVL